jgi:hypothetical protein
MSSQEVVSNTGNMAIINTDTSKIFIWENRYSKANLTNSGYDDVTYPVGTLLGRIGSSQEVVPLVSTATDGSQYPVGILADDYTVEAGDTVEVSFCNYGDVAEEMVVLDAGDTMDTLIDDRSIRDRIASDTVGIRLVPGTELTAEDNS